MMGWYGGGMGAFGWLAMGLFWIILLGLIVWLVTRLLPGSKADQPSRPIGAPAVEILASRRANGDLHPPPWPAPLRARRPPHRERT